VKSRNFLKYFHTLNNPEFRDTEWPCENKKIMVFQLIFLKICFNAFLALLEKYNFKKYFHTLNNPVF